MPCLGGPEGGHEPGQAEALRLRRWAGLALIKQAVLADLAGVARPMISDWTRGARAIPEDVLARFIKAINERLEREGLAERCSRDKLVLPSPIKPDMRSPDQRKQARYAAERRRRGLDREAARGERAASGKPGRAVNYHAGAGVRG